jgi:hypothetical protein
MARRAASMPGMLLGAGAAVAALAVAGCGSMTEAQTAANTGSGAANAAAIRVMPLASRLCARPAAVRQVTIAWSAGTPRVPAGGTVAPQLPSNGGAVSGTAAPGVIPVKIVRVTSAAQARELARAICALPRMPRGPINCPALFLGTFRMSFTAAGFKAPAVVAQESGCEVVTGISPVRTAAGKTAFWRLLARLGGPAAGWPGHLPGGPIAPGLPVLPPGSGSGHGCAPRSASTPPGTPVKSCPGPDRPAGVTKK